MTLGRLSFFCGKMGAGKSTLAAELAAKSDAVLLSEDEWLAALYPGQIRTISDYRQYADRLKPQIRKLAQSLLQLGQNVVLDFPANTAAQRAWLKAVSDVVGAAHDCYVLDVDDATCLARIKQRAEDQPARRATDTEAMFRQMAQYFSLPDTTEKLHLVQQ